MLLINTKKSTHASSFINVKDILANFNGNSCEIIPDLCSSVIANIWLCARDLPVFYNLSLALYEMFGRVYLDLSYDIDTNVSVWSR